MKNQTLYRGSDNKKEKITKAEKVYNAIHAVKRKTVAAPAKKQAAA